MDEEHLRKRWLCDRLISKGDSSLRRELAMIRLDQVRQQREAILQLAAKHGARRVRLFGSVARGESGPASDVDVLVDFEPGRSLLDQVGFEQDLEDLLGCRVEVVVEGGVSPYLAARIMQEAVPL
jgi:predicted nucleotidyltransferase